MRFAVADPPYPPFIGSGGRKNRASRWYGDGQRSATDRPADSPCWRISWALWAIALCAVTTFVLLKVVR